MMKQLVFLTFTLILIGCEKVEPIMEIGAVSDYDGNSYNAVKIGDQWWMAENLKTTHYSNGTLLHLVDNTEDWLRQGSEVKAMCYYNDLETSAKTYGALYTWAAAMNGEESCEANPSNVQGVCPVGWHLPSDAEWKELEMYLGMPPEDADEVIDRGKNEGSILAGNSDLWKDGWLERSSKFGRSGFNALPGAYRNGNGPFDGSLGGSAFYWTSTLEGSDIAWYRAMKYNSSSVGRGSYGISGGLSVRCVKD